jgi:hypothetical protein
MLEKGAEMDELVEAMLSEYNVDEATARADIEEIVELIKARGLLE